MIPIFEGVSGIDTSNPRQAILQLTAYIGRLERQLEQYFMNLGSENLQKLDLDDMTLYTERGTEISGDRIKIVGPGGECFEIGYDKEKKQFVFNLPEGFDINVGRIKATSIEAKTVVAESITGESIVANKELKRGKYNAVVE